MRLPRDGDSVPGFALSGWKPRCWFTVTDFSMCVSHRPFFAFAAAKAKYPLHAVNRRQN